MSNLVLIGVLHSVGGAVLAPYLLLFTNTLFVINVITERKLLLTKVIIDVEEISFNFRKSTTSYKLKSIEDVFFLSLPWSLFVGNKAIEFRIGETTFDFDLTKRRLNILKSIQALRPELREKLTSV